MKIDVLRTDGDDRGTISTILIDGQFVCYGLEDEHRDVKVPGETRIPAGTYKVGLRKTGGFHRRYKKRYAFHEGMLHVQDVPGFTHILIHIGNDDEDTAGCLLLGMRRSHKGNEPKVWYSGDAYRRFYRQVLHAAKRGELTITYRDLDR